MSPAELFHRAGVALFGDQYVAPMAVLLDLDKNIVGKMRNGKSSISPQTWAKLRDALLKRGPEIEAALLGIGNQGLGRAGTQQVVASHLAPIVKARNHADGIISLTREHKPEDVLALRTSLDDFTRRHLLPKGVVAAKGHAIIVDIPVDLDADEEQAFQAWFNAECDRIEREG